MVIFVGPDVVLTMVFSVAGELDCHLQPVGKEMFVCEEEEQWDEEEDEGVGQARPGTTKRKQYYIKKVGSSVQQVPPPPPHCHRVGVCKICCLISCFP